MHLFFILQCSILFISHCILFGLFSVLKSKRLKRINSNKFFTTFIHLFCCFKTKVQHHHKHSHWSKYTYTFYFIFFSKHKDDNQLQEKRAKLRYSSWEYFLRLSCMFAIACMHVCMCLLLTFTSILLIVFVCFSAVAHVVWVML